MTRRVDRREIEDWEGQRVDLRIRAKLAEEKGYAGEDQKELARKISTLTKQINEARGRMKATG